MQNGELARRRAELNAALTLVVGRVQLVQRRIAAGAPPAQLEAASAALTPAVTRLIAAVTRFDAAA
jgi:hypothetical protein